MAEFVQIKLEEMIKELGESEVKNILSSFMSPMNGDVEDFIRNKAILFSKNFWAKTTLVYWVSDDQKEKYLVGYYTLANKTLSILKDAVSTTMSKRLNQHGTYDTDKKAYIIPAVLIGQLSKNFDSGNELLISGSDLLQMALNKIRKIHNEIGGRFVFLECEDEPALIRFYESNGFVKSGKRNLDGDETGIKGHYLLQMIMYLK